mmetsp:Transcript_3846/g.5879  ORF Transcript_3846/g.5879 Transcript_3846/m.5879 type:complete len:652 (+) Transcript_3846:77-2032(+)
MDLEKVGSGVKDDEAQKKGNLEPSHFAPDVEEGGIVEEVGDAAEEEDETPLEGVLVRDRKEVLHEKMMASAVDAANVTIVTEEEPSHCARNKMAYICIAICVLTVVVVFGLVPGILIPKRRSDNKNKASPEEGGLSKDVLSEVPTTSISPSGQPTEIPTATPSMAPSLSFAPTTEKMGFVIEAIGFGYEEGSDLLEPLTDKTSPQYKAALWLAEQDTNVTWPIETAAQFSEFLQRYAATVFYYATDGDNSWLNKANFLSPDKHICDWNAPVLEGGQDLFTIPLPLGDPNAKKVAGIAYCLDFGPDSLGNVALALQLAANNVTGTIPRDLLAFQYLWYLMLPDNSISGGIPDEVYDNVYLQALWLPFNEISGSISSKIGQLSRLQYSWFNNNLLTGTLPSEIGLLTGLYSLQSGYNSLSGTVPTEMGEMAVLQLMELRNNSLYGDLPDSLLNLSNLQQLSMSYCNVSWSLPDNIDSIFPNLNSMALIEVDLVGTIPDSITTLQSLQYLDLTRTGINGTIPVGPWPPSMNILGAGGNSLTGTIPSSLGDLSSLSLLDFSFNELTGRLPESLANLSSLSLFAVNGNEITGNVPQSYGSLSNLASFSISENLITGNMNFLCDANPGMQARSDCFGEIVCDCCFVCCNDDDVCQIK